MFYPKKTCVNKVANQSQYWCLKWSGCVAIVRVCGGVGAGGAGDGG